MTEPFQIESDTAQEDLYHKLWVFLDLNSLFSVLSSIAHFSSLLENAQQIAAKSVTNNEGRRSAKQKEAK